LLLIANNRINSLLFFEKKSLGKQQERLMSKQIEIKNKNKRKRKRKRKITIN
jgi:hypothetical protein